MIVDLHTIYTIFEVALVGALIGLDRTAAGQFMISQPIVAGPLTGWLLGGTEAGLVIGVVLELIWVLDMPVGTFVPADATVLTIASTAIAVLGGGSKPNLDLMGFSILLSALMVPVTMMVDTVIRKYNSRLADAAVAGSGEDAGEALSRAHLRGLAVFFMKSFFLYLVFLPLGLVAVALFSRAPEKVHIAMSLFVKVLPLLGSALVLRKLSIRTFDRFSLAGFVTASLLMALVHLDPLVVLAVTLIAGFAGARLREGFS